MGPDSIESGVLSQITSGFLGGLASMGPDSIESRVIATAYDRPGARRLQWGRTRSSPELRSIAPRPDDYKALQWGRTRSSPELSRSPAASRCRASGFNGAGLDRVRSCIWQSQHATSTAGFNGAGLDRVRSSELVLPEPCDGAGLQWGRTRSSPEFSTSNPKCFASISASMGPDSIESGVQRWRS